MANIMEQNSETAQIHKRQVETDAMAELKAYMAAAATDASAPDVSIFRSVLLAREREVKLLQRCEELQALAERAALATAEQRKRAEVAEGALTEQRKRAEVAEGALTEQQKRADVAENALAAERRKFAQVHAALQGAMVPPVGISDPTVGISHPQSPPTLPTPASHHARAASPPPSGSLSAFDNDTKLDFDEFCVFVHEREEGEHSESELRKRFDVYCASSSPVRPRATEYDIIELSAILNQAHGEIIPPHETRSWFKLFRHIDEDRSGLISWDEFIHMVRKVLKLSPQQMADARLKAVWEALDTSGDGFLQSGEVRAHD